MGTLTPVSDIITSVDASAAAAAASEANAAASEAAAAASAASAAASAGLFAPSVAVTDWNNYVESGIFTAAGILNAPPQVTGANLELVVAVTKISTTKSLQIAYDINGVSIFERYFLSPSWSAWKPSGSIGRKARLKAAVPVSVPTSTWTVVPLDTTTYSENSTDIVLATNTVAAPAWASYVNITLFGKFAVAPVEIALRATKNGGVVAAPYSSREPATTLNQSSETTISFSVAGGNLIGFQIKQTSGATISTLAGWCEMTLEFK